MEAKSLPDTTAPETEKDSTKRRPIAPRSVGLYIGCHSSLTESSTSQHRVSPATLLSPKVLAYLLIGNSLSQAMLPLRLVTLQEAQFL